MPLPSQNQVGRRQLWPACPVQNLPRRSRRNGDIRSLEHQVQTVTAELRPNLDELIWKRRQRPMAYPFRQHQPAEGISEAVRQSKDLQARPFAREVVAREACPVRSVPPPLIHCSAVPRPLWDTTAVEGDNVRFVTMDPRQGSS